MHTVVVANGDLPDPIERERLLALLRSADLVVAADGGLTHCAALGQWPDVLVGDLDSAPVALISEARSAGVRIEQHPSDKDATDLELALATAQDAGADEITVLAAFGGRLDHELATIGLLASQRWAGVAMRATDGRRHLWVLRSTHQFSRKPHEVLSLVPWAGDVTGVTTEGLHWPLRQATLTSGSTLGVSNVVVEPDQRVAVESGTLLAIVDELVEADPTSS